jgi:hypothetical protein
MINNITVIFKVARLTTMLLSSNSWNLFSFALMWKNQDLSDQHRYRCSPMSYASWRMPFAKVASCSVETSVACICCLKWTNSWDRSAWSDCAAWNPSKYWPWCHGSHRDLASLQITGYHICSLILSMTCWHLQIIKMTVNLKISEWIQLQRCSEIFGTRLNRIINHCWCTVFSSQELHWLHIALHMASLHNQ